MHKEKSHERGFANGNGKRRDRIPFAEVNESDTCGEGREYDQCGENQEIELLGYNVARYQ